MRRSDTWCRVPGVAVLIDPAGGVHQPLPRANLRALSSPHDRHRAGIAHRASNGPRRIATRSSRSRFVAPSACLATLARACHHFAARLNSGVRPQGETQITVTHDQVLAFAVYEIRLLLANHLGSDSTSDPPVRAAAHLAYALHNQADAVLQGGAFDPQQAAAALGEVDRLLATDFQIRLSQAVGNEA